MEDAQPTVFLADLGSGYTDAVEEGLEYVGFFRRIAAGSTVFLKPNLTFPEYRPGVMTSFDCLAAVVRCLRSRHYEVIIGEADSGGYNRFSMDAVFEGMGIHQLCAATGAKCLNLSFSRPRLLELKVGWRKLKVPVPDILFDGTIDAFISLPVPKVHLNTVVSLSIKNQWGCIQEPGERLKLHPYFSEVMFALNAALPNAFSVVDGWYGLTRSGPLRGDAVELKWLLVSNDLVAADRACCKLMRIDERRVKHLMYFQANGWWPKLEQARANKNLQEFQRGNFFLKRTWTDLPGLACFNSRFLAWLGYNSPLAGFAHWLLYLVREPFYDAAEQKKKVRSRSTDLSAEE
jgi:uncharacterized protein (DUF362 family)